MTIERHFVGPRVSKAAVSNGVVYLAGQIAAEFVPTVRGQTEQILAQIDNLLKLAGTDKSKLLSTTIVMSDVRHADEINAVWDTWVAESNTPPRTVFEAKLINPKAFLVITVTAAK